MDILYTKEQVDEAVRRALEYFSKEGTLSISGGGTGASTPEGALNALGALPTAGGLMKGAIDWGNNRHISAGGSDTDFDFVAGKVAIRLIPENAVGNDISKCANLLDTGNGALYPIATATTPQEYDLSLESGAVGAAKVYKNPFNEVTLMFSVSLDGGVSFGKHFATAPLGFCPAQIRNYPAVVQMNSENSTLFPAFFNVETNGTIKYYGPTYDYPVTLVGFANYIA